MRIDGGDRCCSIGHCSESNSKGSVVTAPDRSWNLVNSTVNAMENMPESSVLLSIASCSSNTTREVRDPINTKGSKGEGRAERGRKH